MARKSIIASFGDLTGGSGQTQSSDKSASPTAQRKAPTQRVGAGVIGATQRSLTDIREERDRLQAIVESGTGFLELDPNLIDNSPIPDRLPDDDEDNFEAFRKTIEQEGQKVPIEVRRHPETEGRYQVVYGNRRLRSARELGISVKAFVVELTDREVVVAQGIENGNRQDLSWIEKALFAARMEDTGIKARDIRAALTVDDAELARYRSVCRSLTPSVIEKIGRAPKVGRPRWVELAGLVRRDRDLSVIEETLSTAKVLETKSDSRFKIVLETLKGSSAPEMTTRKLEHSALGEIGKATFGTKDVRLAVAGEYADDFKAFMEDELASLLERFYKTRKGSQS